MTNDDERVAYLAGDEGTEIDDLSRADLDELMALLGDADVWAEPGDHLEDAVVAAIAAEGARPAPVEAPPRQRRARRTWTGPRAALAAAAAVAALAVAGVVVSRSGDDVVGEASLEGPGASGTARLSQTDSGWRIELDAEGLPRLDDGRFYQAWLKNDDDVLVAIGTFNEPDDVVLWAGVSPKVFRTLTVTEESADGDQASSGIRVLAGTITLD